MRFYRDSATMPHVDDRIKSRAEQVVSSRNSGRDVPNLVRELYDSGLSQDDVAKTLGVHRATLARWMRDWGIPTRDRRAVVTAAAREAASA